MKLIDQLIKKVSEESGFSQKDVHEAVMYQFEYVSRAVKGEETKIEISGLGYFDISPSKLNKNYQKYLQMRDNMRLKYERLESESERVIFKYKLDTIEEIVSDYEIKLENLEKKKADSGRISKQDIP